MTYSDIKLLIVDLWVPFKKFVWDVRSERLSVY